MHAEREANEPNKPALPPPSTATDGDGGTREGGEGADDDRLAADDERGRGADGLRAGGNMPKRDRGTGTANEEPAAKEEGGHNTDIPARPTAKEKKGKGTEGKERKRALQRVCGSEREESERRGGNEGRKGRTERCAVRQLIGTKVRHSPAGEEHRGRWCRQRLVRHPTQLSRRMNKERLAERAVQHTSSEAASRGKRCERHRGSTRSEM